MSTNIAGPKQHYTPGNEDNDFFIFIVYRQSYHDLSHGLKMFSLSRLSTSKGLTISFKILS